MILLYTDYTMINVSKQETDKDSILSYYKELKRFRNSELAISTGAFETIFEEDKDLFAYKRVHEKELNTENFGKCVVNNYDVECGKMRPYEVCVFKKRWGSTC